MKFHYPILLILFSIVIGLSSCGKDDPEPGPDNEVVPKNLKVADEVVVIDSTLTLTSSSVDLKNGVYKYLINATQPDVHAGSVIVDTLNGGYLRKVEKSEVQGSILRLETVQATLGDLFEEGSLDFHVNLGNPYKSFTGDDGIQYSLVEEKLERGATTSNHVDYQLNAAFSNELTVTGGFTVEPRFNFKWKFSKDKGLETFHCYLDNTRINLETTLALTAKVNTSATVQKSLGKVVKRGWFFIYGIPVVFDVEVEFLGVGYVSFKESANFPISFTNTSTLSYGIAYENGSTNFVTGFANHSEINTTPVFEASGKVRLDIIPQINIRFYGVLSNVIKPKPYLELEAKYITDGDQHELCAQIDAGLDLTLGVSSEIYGKEIFNLSKDFSIAETTLWKSKDNCILPNITLSEPAWAIGSHACTNATAYTVTMTIDDPDGLVGPGTTLYALHRFYSSTSPTSGSITRKWEDMTLNGDQLSYNICISWVSATYVEQSFYLVTTDGTRSNLITVIIPHL